MIMFMIITFLESELISIKAERYLEKNININILIPEARTRLESCRRLKQTDKILKQ